MTTRIAIVDNLSALAWRQIPQDFPAEVWTGAPADTLHWMAEGEVDAALVPVAGMRQLRQIGQEIGPFGIACTGRVSSVRLFTCQPLPSLIHSRTPIYVTQQSRTASQLLRVLCWREFDREPRITDHIAETEARLLIGDDAVDLSRDEQNWPCAYDLCEWWFRQTGLPFVFARWVVRTGVNDATRGAILEWLEQSATAAESQEGKAALAARAVAEGRLRQGHSFARNYYEQIRPRLTPHHIKGMQRFDTLRWELEPWTKTA